MSKQLKIVSLGLLVASCNAASAQSDSSDPFQCGVALVIEREVAKGNRLNSLAEDLGPIIEWYAAKSGALPEGARGEAAGYALMNRFTGDPSLRKTVGKACVRAAFQDPAFTAALPQLKAKAAQ